MTSLTDRRSTWGFAAALLVVSAVTAAVFWPALSAQAVWFDDAHYLHQNHLVKSPSWRSAGIFLSEVTRPSTIGGYYQPLSMISLMLDYGNAGTTADLRAYHRTSLFLHVANSVLLMTILYRLFGSILAAALIASLHGIHPIMADSVLWIAERKTVLGTFFALASITCYLEFVRRRQPALLIASALAFLLAALSKPTVVPLPIVLLLLDFWPLRRAGRGAILEKIPFFVIAAAIGAITILSQSKGAGLKGVAGLSTALWIVSFDLWFYASHLFWPGSVVGYYSPPSPLSWENPIVRTAAGLTVVSVICIVVSLKWTRTIFTGAAIFFVLLFPTMGLLGFTDILTANRFAYLPAIGLAMPLCAGLSLLLKSRRAIQIVPAIAASLIALAIETRANRSYIANWKTSESLCRHMVAAAPTNAKVRTRYGEFLVEASRHDEALEQLDEALQIDPHYGPAFNNRASALIGLARYHEAWTAVKEALTRSPEDPGAWVNKGTLWAREGSTREAIRCYQQALQTRPGFAFAHTAWGMALAAEGRFPDAIEQYTLALRLNPDDAVAHDQLGVSLAALGRTDEARSHFREAIRLRPDYESPRKHLEMSGSHLNTSK